MPDEPPTLPDGCSSRYSKNQIAILAALTAVSRLHHQARGFDQAKVSGRTTVDTMKRIPTDDDCFGPGSIRIDGRKLHPAYLFRVKKPEESKSLGDVYDLVATIPASEAFRPLAEGGCSYVKT